MPTATAFGAPNPLRLAKRFFWKECRRLVVLTVGVLLLAVALMTLVWWLTPRSVDPADPLSIIAIGGGMMLAVAAAATLFSVEKEEGTAELLERLPRNVVAMTIGKLSSAIVIVPLCTLALLTIAVAITGDSLDVRKASDTVVMASLFLVEAFVWSLVASLACPNPLVAAVLGIALTSVSVQLGIAAAGTRGFTTIALDAAAPTRLALAGVGILIAGWLVTLWPAPPRRRRGAVAADVDSLSRKRLGWPSLGLGLFGRLFWQSLRQSWATGFVAALIGLFLTFMGVLIFGFVTEFSSGWHMVSICGLLFAPAMLGAVVFRADQRRDAYRFLAEHAGRPRMLWLARNAAGIAMLTVFLAAVLPIAYWLGSFESMDRAMRWSYDASASVEVLRLTQAYGFLRQLLLLASAAAVTAYAYGQFFSLALRSDVIAAMMALTASIVLSAWVGIVWMWQLPPLPFLLPLAIGALLATLVRSRDWMFDRRGLWRWLAPIALLVAPLAWLYGATPMTRLAQVDVPLASARTGDRSYTRFDELVKETQEELRIGKETAEAYDRLKAKVVTYEVMGKEAAGANEIVFAIESPESDKSSEVTVAILRDGAFDGENLEEFIRLSRIKCRLPTTTLGSPSSVEALVAAASIDGRDNNELFALDRQLERLLVRRRVANQEANFSLLHEGRDNSYLSYEIVRWASEFGQTSARIVKAIRGLREAEAMLIGPVGLLMNQHYQAKAILTGEHVPQFRQDKEHQLQPEDWVGLAVNESVHSEGRRALKALDVLASYEAAYLAQGMHDLTSRSPDLSWLQTYYVDDVLLATKLSTDYYFSDRVQVYQRDLRAVTNARTSMALPRVFDNRNLLSAALRDWMYGVAMRRAERVRLALIAYRIDHDEYPESLDALAPAYLEESDLYDPYSNHLFGWRRQGFDLPVVNHEDLWYTGPGPINARTPVLWCSGIAAAQPVEGVAERDKGNNFRVHTPYRGISRGVAKDIEEESSSLERVVYLQSDGHTVHWHSQFWLPVPVPK